MDDVNVHEIVIIKRARHDGDEGHHGGVWKIAFADFMTAMMAFFLVMWLISANDKTRATIARYFNPVQLVDSTPQPRGLNDPKPGAPNVMPAEKPDPPGKLPKQAESLAPEPAEKPGNHEEAELFKDPYAVLAEIAAKNSALPPNQNKAPTEGTMGGSGRIGAKGGDAYRDPFEPSPNAVDRPNGRVMVTDDPAPPVPDGVPAKPAATAGDGQAKADAAPIAVPKQPREQAATATLSRISAWLKQAKGTAFTAMQPQADVRRTDEGLLIGLTDGADFSMFASGSAEPTPKMVEFMAKIGKLLKGESGKVSIRGYTDGRPFKSTTYDNWRLSSARAHMAHYMLVRGGLDEQRVDRIEGYADRHLKNPKDPGSPENRRIEILLRDTAP